ncbi:MAG: hypothetical protein GX595_14280 [Lentisphaerae bacterium]|nr:hypothetical protein [Lentisphaerota bacterium]
MSTTTTAKKTILTATGHGGHHYDDAALRAWYCDDSDAGRWLVIGGRDLGLAIGDTREEALADAARCCGEPVAERDADDETRVEVVQICGTPVETLSAALVAAIDQSRQQDEIVRIDVCDIEASTEILEGLADEAGEEIGYTDTHHGTVREVWGAVDADRSVWRLEMCQR